MKNDNELLPIIQELGQKHGYLNILKSLFSAAADRKLSRDLDMGGILNELFKRDKSYTTFEYLDQDDIDDFIWQLEYANYKFIKVDSLVEEMRIDAFLDELKSNPYQLNLIA
jgi:muconolactone delta-isomerase